MKKQISYFCLAIILFQSCVVYQKTPVDIEDAYNQGKVKVVYEDGHNFTYENLIYKDGVTYCVTSSVKKDKEGKKEYMTTKLPTYFEAIYLKDVTNSTVLSVIIGVSIPVSILLGIYLIALASF